MPSFNTRSNAVGYDLTPAAINISASGNTTIVPALGPNDNIRIFKLALVVAGATVLTFLDTLGNALWGAQGTTMFAGGSVVLDFDTQPWFTCAPGAGFVLGSTNPVQITGGLYYNRVSTP